MGRAGVAGLNLARVTLHLDEVCIVRDVGRAVDYEEKRGQDVMRKNEITINVDLARGPHTTTV
ncbi:MAG TPA: hypothetical protein VN418_07600 [Gammaproteobacteria bacterium]|nr:hypothetical protein [Gammaproteobacteria bacterium]